MRIKHVCMCEVGVLCYNKINISIFFLQKIRSKILSQTTVKSI